MGLTKNFMGLREEKLKRVIVICCNKRFQYYSLGLKGFGFDPKLTDIKLVKI